MDFELAKEAARASLWMNATNHVYSKSSERRSTTFDVQNFLYVVKIGKTQPFSGF